MTATDATPTAVEATLDRYGEMVRDAMGHRLSRAEPAPWLDEVVADYPNRPGKSLRPAILLATCEAFGGLLHEALGAAVSIELLHNAFLVHDDIEDGSLLRRGRPTLHRTYGVPLALNAGDALALLALDPLRLDARLGSRLARRLTDELTHTARRTVEGQAVELGWRRDVVVDLTPDDYLELIGRKTCWYTTIHPLRAGALIGSRATAGLGELTRFGYLLGAAFQIRDDLLNLVGAEAVYGKELHGDVREGKRTLMMIHLLGAAEPAERAFLLDYLARPESERTDDEVGDVVALMDRHGSIDFAVEYGRGIGAAAHDAFDVAFGRVPASEHRDFLCDLVAWMLERRL